jgi:hypothetical protein
VTKYHLGYSENREESCDCGTLQYAKEASTNDDIWLPSEKEVGGNTVAQHYSNCSSGGYGLRDYEPNGHHYADFFLSNDNRIKKNVNGAVEQWLLRSKNNNPDDYWCVVKTGGSVSYQSYGSCVIGFCT